MQNYNLAIIKDEYVEIQEELRYGAYLFLICEAKEYNKYASMYENKGLLIKDAIFYTSPEKTYIIGILQKPIYKTYVDNAIEFNCGCLNIKKCRIGTEKIIVRGGDENTAKFFHGGFKEVNIENEGRFPANFIINSGLAEQLDNQSGFSKSSDSIRKNNQNKTTGQENGAVCYGKYNSIDTKGFKDEGGASRFFKNVDTLEALYDYLLDLGLQPSDNKIYSNIDYVNNYKKEENKNEKEKNTKN